MCYASPGPRCYSHASAAASKAKEKADALFESILDARSEASVVSELIKNETNNEKIDSLIAVRNELVKKAEQAASDHRVACAKWERAERDAEATIGGITNLYNTVREQENAAKPDYKVIAETTIRLNNAKRYFQAKLRKYDEAYGTVNGKKPSRWASEYGVRHLDQQIDKYQKRRATLDRNDPKYLSSTKKLKSLMEQKAHAMETLRAIQQGRPGIKDNDEFQNSLHRPPGYAGVDEQLVHSLKNYDSRGMHPDREQDVLDALRAKRHAYEVVLEKIKSERAETDSARRAKKQKLAYNTARLEDVKKYEAKFSDRVRS